MKNSQKITALVIVIIALLLSGFLVLNKTKHRLSFNFPVSPIHNETVVIEADKDSTRGIAEEIAEAIFAENPKGPRPIGDGFGISAKSPEELIEEILAESTAEAEQTVLMPELFFDDLEIIKNATKSDLAFYLKNRGEIIASAQQEAVERGADLSNPNIATFSILLSVTSKAIAELYNLPVPEEILLIHKEQIRLLAIQENIFKNLVNYERDPVLASVSVSLLFSSNEDLNALSKTIATFIEENNIEI